MRLRFTRDQPVDPIGSDEVIGAMERIGHELAGLITRVALSLMVLVTVAACIIVVATSR